MKILVAVLSLLFSNLALADVDLGFTGLSLQKGQMVVMTVYTPVPQIHAFIVENNVAPEDKVVLKLDIPPGSYKVNVLIREKPLSNNIIFNSTDTVNVPK